MSEWNDSNPVSNPQQAESTVSGSGANNSSSSAPPRKKANGVLIGVIVLLVGVIGVMAYAMLRPKPIEEKVTDGRATFVSPDNVEEVREQLKKPVTDAYYKTSMSVDWYFDNAAAVSTSAYVGNHEDNTRTVYFEVRLDETGEVVLSSPYLPVGERMEQIQLDKKDLEAGDYPAVLTYYLVDDDHEVITYVSVAITIHILN